MLRIIATTKTIVGTRLVNPSERDSAVAQTDSMMPDRTRTTQSKEDLLTSARLRFLRRLFLTWYGALVRIPGDGRILP